MVHRRRRGSPLLPHAHLPQIRRSLNLEAGQVFGQTLPFICGYYRVAKQVSDYILLTLNWWFHRVAYIMPCKLTSELPNQSQQNVVTDLTGHPVLLWENSTK